MENSQNGMVNIVNVGNNNNCKVKIGKKISEKKDKQTTSKTTSFFSFLCNLIKNLTMKFCNME